MEKTNNTNATKSNNAAASNLQKALEDSKNEHNLGDVGTEEEIFERLSAEEEKK